MPERPTLFPSITPDNEPFIDDSYQRAELERMDYATELKPLAAEHPSDDVDGSMSAAEIVEALTGEQRINE
jgi:hypothetical protein